MKIKVEKLTRKTLEDSIQLIERTFTLYPEDIDHPRKWIPATINPNSKKSKKQYLTTGCTEQNYFVALHKKKVIGLIGYYTLKEDEKNSDWIAWFAVDKKYRRKGIGTLLLQLIIDNARKRSKKYLRAYIGETKAEKAAHKFYDKHGIRQVKRAKNPYQKNSNIIYRKLKL